MKFTEQKLQISVVDYLRYVVRGRMQVFSIPNEGKRSAAANAQLKRAGLTSGVADLCMIYDGRAHFMELKAPKGKLTENQEKFSNDIRSAGAGWGIVRSIDDVEMLLAIWDIPTRKAK